MGEKTFKEAMLEIVADATNAEYQHLMPEGYRVSRVAEYDPEKHTAPNLHFEKLMEVPNAKYLVNLSSDTSSVPALGSTVNEAIKRAIVKIESRRNRPHD